VCSAPSPSPLLPPPSPCGDSTLTSGATGLMKTDVIMHNHLIGPMHYALCSQQRDFPPTELVPTQIPCITRIMQHECMHYDNFNCTSYMSPRRS
jgi:hypothetical protein